MLHKGKIVSLLGIMISVVIVGVLVFNLDFKEFSREVASFEFKFFPILLVLMLMANFFRSLRWRIILPIQERVSILHLFEGIIVGFTASYLLPLRAGELVRAFYISKIEKVSFSGAFASVVTERVFDILTVLGALAICVGYMPSVPAIVSIGAKSIGVFALVVTAMIVVAYVAPRAILRLAYLFCKKLTGRSFSSLSRKVVGTTREFISGLQGLSGVKDLLMVIIYSIAVWLCYVGFYALFVSAMGAEGTVLMGAVLTVSIALAIAAPSAPGFIGTYQAGCVIALTTIFGFNQAFSVAYSVITHFMQACVTILIGFFFLTRRGTSLAELLSRDKSSR